MTPIGWSPDGRHMAFVREDLGRGVFELVLAEADGANPRVLTTRKHPAFFDSLSLISQPSVRPAWSLDGRVIAVPGALRSPDFQEQIVFVDSTSGAEQALPVQGAGAVYGLDWIDAGSLVLDQVVETGGPSQLWRLAYPSGAVTRLTNDLGSYVDVSITAARDSLVTTKTDRRVAIWVSDGSGANAKEVVPATQSSGNGGRRDMGGGSPAVHEHDWRPPIDFEHRPGWWYISGGRHSRVCSDLDLRRQDGCIQIDRSSAPRALEGHRWGSPRAAVERASRLAQRDTRRSLGHLLVGIRRRAVPVDGVDRRRHARSVDERVRLGAHAVAGRQGGGIRNSGRSGPPCVRNLQPARLLAAAIRAPATRWR